MTSPKPVPILGAGFSPAVEPCIMMGNDFGGVILKSKFMKIGWYVFAAGILLLGGGLFYVQSQFQPPSDSGQAVEITVPEGAGAEDVGVQLKEKELIKNAKFFSLYLRYEGQSGLLKTGKYYLRQGMTMEEIARVLVEGDASYNTVQFTVPEGLTLEQIAEALDKQGLVKKDDFLKEADSGQFDYDFVKEIPQNEAVEHRLEGYLFPETYEVFKEADAHQLIDTMLKQTAAVFTPEWREQMKARGLSVHQALTVASLIEREAQAAKERPMIAGVIDNRLKAPMKLQIDATIQFALGKQKETLLFADLEIESPYNTYKYEGLPPGPIASPGRDSIKAALYPAQHEFLFYVTKNDGTGEHYFAKTFAEHEQNIAKSGL